MARPREFNTTETLKKVIQIFWENGFEKTSFSDLEQATGLGKGSLFAAFGDKENLFKLALKQYEIERAKIFSDTLCSSSPRRSLEKWLLLASGFDAPHSKDAGCFILNTLVEKAPHDKRCALIIEEYQATIEKMLEKLLESGRKTGKFRKNLNCCAGARYLMCLAYGLQAKARSPKERGNEKERKEILKLAFRCLE